MKSVNRQSTRPLRTPRTRRNHPLSVLSSPKAGVCYPLAAMPLLREDQMRGQVSIAIEMLETHEILMNSTRARITAYVVPFLAFDRFEGSRDQLDRSYAGEPKVEGGAVVPFFETAAMGALGANPIYRALGLHGKPTDMVNTAYLEAYNQIINFRRKNRSPKLAMRERLDSTLAEAFWLNSQWEHVVPDFDQAVIDGEVALNIVEQKMPVRGIGVMAANPRPTAYYGTYESPMNGQQDLQAREGWRVRSGGPAAGEAAAELVIKSTNGVDFRPDIWAEMQENGISVSLSNIAMARKAQWFAKMRERFNGFDDDYIIDMLMSGLEIPDQSLKQPILLADVTARFQQVKRYATDSGNLAESAVSGAAMASFDLNVPRLNTGGVVMLMVECLPDQLWERQRDPFFYTSDVASLPDYLRDEMDPEKVDIVRNGQVDTDHATPNATFGYEPMNGKWNRWGPRIGGKFLRPSVNTVADEERQRIWAHEQVNPTLADSFYLVKGLHNKVFLDTETDPFEAAVSGGCVITGNTVFGGMLVEATNDYDEVMAKAPTERIEKGA